MNKDLTMKAAIQFKGVWPDNKYCKADEQRIGLCLDSYKENGRVYEESGIYPVGCDAISSLWSIVCTRKQFESFVESLFDGAPEGATHYSPKHNNCHESWWKINNDDCFVICEKTGISTWLETRMWGGLELIPHPARAEPKSPYMPNVGEECEYYHIMDHNPELDGWRKCFVIGFIKDGKTLAFHSNETDELHLSMGSVRFRPLRTDREQFIERCTTDYLDRVGSDAVNEKWFGRIFGTMYDSGCRYLQS